MTAEHRKLMREARTALANMLNKMNRKDRHRAIQALLKIFCNCCGRRIYGGFCSNCDLGN